MAPLSRSLVLLTAGLLAVPAAANPVLDRALIAAVEDGDLVAVTDALAAGADPDARKAQKDGPRPTALMLAAAANRADIVQALLAGGADAGARGKDGRTALDVAVESGHTRIAELLAARDARRAVEAAPPPAVYSPPAGYETADELSAESLSWSRLVLQRMEEPGLCEDTASLAEESFRFLWIRTFDEPVMVRVEGGADGSAELTALVLDGQGGYDFGIPGRRVTRTVKPKHWRELREQAAAASFRQLPAEARETDTIVLDGASWALEERWDGGCHVVWRHSPEPDGPWAGFRRLCRTVLDLARLGARARPVY